jgi:DUF4097 and DUF4098 domain-containing protein YvlB
MLNRCSVAYTLEVVTMSVIKISKDLALRLTAGLIILSGILVAVGCGGGRMSAQAMSEGYSEREESRESYKLQPGSRVSVKGINGTVGVETADVETAEVHIVREARRREHLERHKVIVEHTESSLSIRGENDSGGGLLSLFRPRVDVRQIVTLKLPRRVEFRTGGVNGAVNIGLIDGPVAVSGVNGRVEVGKSAGTVRFSGINGSVTATVASLGDEGMRVNGINGPVELRLAPGIDADVTVRGLNGRIDNDLSELVVDDSQSKRGLKGRLGKGGSAINISGVNGNLRLTSAPPEQAASSKAL